VPRWPWTVLTDAVQLVNCSKSPDRKQQSSCDQWLWLSIARRLCRRQPTASVAVMWDEWPNTTFGHCWSSTFIVWIPFLSLNKWHQSSINHAINERHELAFHACYCVPAVAVVDHIALMLWESCSAVLYSLGWVVLIDIGVVLVDDYHSGDAFPQETPQSCTVSNIDWARSEATRKQTPRWTDQTILSQRRISDASCTADADVPTRKYYSHRPQSSERRAVSLS